MGKSSLCTANLQQFTRPTSSPKLQTPKQAEPTSRSRVSNPEKARSTAVRIDAGRVKQKEMDSWEGRDRVPLSEVVAELVKAWFEDALEAAMAGDNAMQVLVGQMYCSGYGVPKDVQKGRSWIKKASQSRSSALKVGNKHPGYNASDSDSDELKDDAN